MPLYDEAIQWLAHKIAKGNFYIDRSHAMIDNKLPTSCCLKIENNMLVAFYTMVPSCTKVISVPIKQVSQVRLLYGQRVQLYTNSIDILVEDRCNKELAYRSEFGLGLRIDCEGEDNFPDRFSKAWNLIIKENKRYFPKEKF